MTPTETTREIISQAFEAWRQGTGPIGRGVANDGRPYENSYAWIMKLDNGKVIPFGLGSYGLGWQVESTPFGRSIGHNGGWPGFSTVRSVSESSGKLTSPRPSSAIFLANSRLCSWLSILMA